MKNWRSTVLAAGLVLTASVASAQQIPADLQEAIRARDEAVAKKDAATWDRLTTPDFTLVDEDGRMMKKTERLTQLKGGKPEAPSKLLQQVFSRYGETVVRRAQAPDNTWFIDVWVKDVQGWRVAAVQVTRIAKK